MCRSAASNLGAGATRTGRRVRERGLSVRRCEVMGNPIPQTVLLVDDEPSIRTYVKSILQHEGLEVIVAGDGVDALALLRCLGRPVDLLITDIKMPRMMGTDLGRLVRTDYPTTPVVYISGDRLERDLHDPARQMVFVAKPFRAQILLDAVWSLLPAPASASASTI